MKSNKRRTNQLGLVLCLAPLVALWLGAIAALFVERGSNTQPHISVALACVGVVLAITLPSLIQVAAVRQKVEATSLELPFVLRGKWILYEDHLFPGMVGNEIYYRNLSRIEIHRQAYGNAYFFQLQLTSRYRAEPYNIWLQDFKLSDTVAMLRLLRERAPQAEMNELALRFSDGEVPIA